MMKKVVINALSGPPAGISCRSITGAGSLQMQAGVGMAGALGLVKHPGTQAAALKLLLPMSS